MGVDLNYRSFPNGHTMTDYMSSEIVEHIFSNIRGTSTNYTDIYDFSWVENGVFSKFNAWEFIGDWDGEDTNMAEEAWVYYPK